MLPIAAALLEQGTAEDFYARAEQQDFKGRCIFFEPELKLGAPGHCGIYEHRPLICRLFSSSGNTDKSGKTRLVVCSLIKETQAVPFQQAAADVLSGRLAAPVMGHYNMRIMAVDAELARENLSINSAFKRAIERIFMHKKLSGTGLSSFVKE
jgi:Fe-S-cluster containining protein